MFSLELLRYEVVSAHLPSTPNVKLTGRGPRKRENKKRLHGGAPVERNVRLKYRPASCHHALENKQLLKVVVLCAVEATVESLPSRSRDELQKLCNRPCLRFPQYC